MNFSTLQIKTRGIIRDDFVGDAVLLAFPSSQARTLQARAGFIHQHMYALAMLMGVADSAKRCAPVHHGERAGIAMVDDGITVINQAGAVFCEAEIGAHIVLSQFQGFADDAFHEFVFGNGRIIQQICNLTDSPGQVHCRRPGVGERGSGSTNERAQILSA